VARVYSDPALNVFDVELAGSRAHAAGHPELSFEPRGPLTRLAPGLHRVGVRAHDVRVVRRSENDIRVPAVVTLEEIHGSETLLRAASGELQWTCQLHGVQRHALGAQLELFISPERLLIFDQAGQHGAD